MPSALRQLRDRKHGVRFSAWEVIFKEKAYVNTEHAKRIYFEQLKRTVPLTLVLAHYGIELRKQGQQLYGPCPIHGSGKNRRQFSVNPATSEWRCFGNCDRGGAMLEFVAAMERVEIVEAARLIAQWFAIGSSSNSKNHNQQRRRTMSGGRPTMKAFVVEDKEEGSDEKPFWTRVGSAWPHGDGKGLNIQIASGVAVSGRMVLREYTEADAQEDEKKAGKFKKK